MKKGLIILLSLFCSFAAAENRQNVAIYMAGEEPAGAPGMYNVLGGELAKAISNSKKYIAVDRTDAIVNLLTREHKFQRSGAVSDDQIKSLGKQFGVRYLCIAELSELQGGSYYLEIRLVDVVTAVIVHTVTASSDLKDSAEMIRFAQQAARELIDTGADGVKDDKPSAKETTKKRTALAAGVGLDVLGAGLLTYGLYEELNARNLIKDKKLKDADKAVRNRNAACIVGSVLLLSGISVHIIF